jgi:hypothetical protein
MTSFFYVVSIEFHTSVPALLKCMDPSRKKFFCWERSHSCTVCSTSSSDLMPFMNYLVHSYTFCSDRHAWPYLTFNPRRISMGFTTSLLRKRMTERCSSLVHVASGTATFTLLLRRHVAFLHRTATCQSFLKPWVSLLSTYKTNDLCFEFLSHF